ncbi:13218_t:CDS:2, partial [Gigaspora margarita]
MNPQYLPKSSERKRVNPLIDLVETEKIYISDLRCLLKRVTSCWSSEDLPPPELDTLFRAIEEIYKRNKQFYSKLAKYGTSPQSAEVLGDALMAWVDEMEEPYKNYCQKPRQGFNKREDIEENLDISAENNQPVSLDYFFDIPIKRLHYYKKLYMRLFKSTEPERAVTPVKDQGFRSSPVQEPEFHSPLLERLQQNQERTVTPVKDQGFRSSP